MNQIEKLFKLWSCEQIDSPRTQKLYCEILEYLYANCSEQVREQISSYILDFAAQTEQAAYIAGFRECFSLWMNALSLNGK